MSHTIQTTKSDDIFLKYTKQQHMPVILQMRYTVLPDDANTMNEPNFVFRTKRSYFYTFISIIPTIKQFFAMQNIVKF